MVHTLVQTFKESGVFVCLNFDLIVHNIKRA